MGVKLDKIIGKVVRHDNHEFVACVQPAEALALIEAGALPHGSCPVARFEESVAQGDSARTWFYFRVKANSELARRAPAGPRQHDKGARKPS
jgi:hypothetical protein